MYRSLILFCLFMLSVTHNSFAMGKAASLFSQNMKNIEQRKFESVPNDYNTEIVFMGKNGDYFTDVDVVIRDKNGISVISNNIDSPYLLTDLVPGYYMVEASVNGHKRVKRIFVERSLKTYYFKFPKENNIQVFANASLSNVKSSLE